MKKQVSSITAKINQGAATTNQSATNTPAQLTSDQLNALIDNVVSKNIKNAPVNSGNAERVKMVISANFNDREKGILGEMLSAYNSLPANPTDQQLFDMLPNLQVVTDKYGAEFVDLINKLNSLLKEMGR